jgi:hypothetical protein
VFQRVAEEEEEQEEAVEEEEEEEEQVRRRQQQQQQRRGRSAAVWACLCALVGRWLWRELVMGGSLCASASSSRQSEADHPTGSSTVNGRNCWDATGMRGLAPDRWFACLCPVSCRTAPPPQCSTCLEGPARWRAWPHR